MNPSTELLAELTNLHRLTQTEIQIAETRRSQARDERIEHELAENARKGRERALRLDQAIRGLGGSPDVVGLAFGRLSAAAKAVTEQVTPFTEALLGDLALEHQLHDRAIYTKVLAQQAGRPDIEQLMRHLELAHAATIEWLTTRLSEVALGGPPALRPTPPQAVAQAWRSAVTLPVRASTQVVNRLVTASQRFRSQAQDQAGFVADRARDFAEAAGDTLAAGRDATLQRGEQEAREAGAPGAAQNIHEVREDIGSLEPSELPVKGYAELGAPQATQRLREVEDPEVLRTMMAWERAHANRTSVVQAAQDRLEELARLASLA